MTGIEIAIITGVPAVSLAGSMLVAWGSSRGERKIYVTHPQHREICSEKSEATFKRINEVVDAGNQQRGEILRAIGRIEGAISKMNGNTGG